MIFFIKLIDFQVIYMAGFQGRQGWNDKVITADSIWSQVKTLLQARSLSMPTTPRRPDVRLILDNVSGVDQIFRNPANHANDKSELIPATGDKTATMVMVAGDTLAEQSANAEKLFTRFNLGERGLSSEFVAALRQDRADGLVQEAYGPAPYAAQASKLVDVVWPGANGKDTVINPVHGAAGSYGARAATDETVMLALVEIYIQGTTTVPEMIQSSGMAIAVTKDYQTGVETTRPIVASVAREFYGAHFDNIPAISVHPDNGVRSIDLKDGTVIDLNPSSQQRAGTASPRP